MFGGTETAATGSDHDEDDEDEDDDDDEDIVDAVERVGEEIGRVCELLTMDGMKQLVLFIIGVCERFDDGDTFRNAFSAAYFAAAA